MVMKSEIIGMQVQDLLNLNFICAECASLYFCKCSVVGSIMPSVPLTTQVSKLSPNGNGVLFFLELTEKTMIDSVYGMPNMRFDLVRVYVNNNTIMEMG